MLPRDYQQIAINLSIATISFIVTAGGLELGVRQFWYRVPATQSCIVPDAITGYRTKPSCAYQAKESEQADIVSYAINECSLRDSRPCSRPPDAFTLLAIGDSFTFGALTHEDNTYPRVAEKHLQSHSGRAIRYLNAGVCGWDLPNYAAEFEQRVASIKPQIVTLGILPNDFFPDLEAPVKPLSREDIRPGLEQFARSIIKNSLTFDLFSHLLMSSDAAYVKLYMLRSGEDSYLQKEYSPYWQGKVKTACSMVEKMQTAAAKHGARFIPILIPQRVQVLIAKHQGDFPDLDGTKLSSELTNCFQKLGLQSIDTMPALLSHTNPASLYYPVDGHLTDEGQRMVGDMVGEALSNF